MTTHVTSDVRRRKYFVGNEISVPNFSNQKVAKLYKL